MDPSTMLISPKPRKAISGPRRPQTRSSYESKTVFVEESSFEIPFIRAREVSDNCQNQANVSKSEENTMRNPFSMAPDCRNSENKLKFNFLEDIEKDNVTKSVHDEIFSILNDTTSIKSSILSQDELSPSNFYSSSDSLGELKKMRSVPERPSNPMYKNYENQDFLEATLKSLSEDFS